MSDIERIFIKTDNLPEQEDMFKKQDPFIKSWDDIKGMSGLNTNFKRRAARQISKLDTSSTAYIETSRSVSSGILGARSKEINPGTVYVNGYGMFDVITPPWNLYELANYYDTSFANHAAIDAKVENIVGLGYDFHVSERTMARLEDADDAQRQRARKRIERAKTCYRDWETDRKSTRLNSSH